MDGVEGVRIEFFFILFIYFSFYQNKGQIFKERGRERKGTNPNSLLVLSPSLLTMRVSTRVIAKET